MSLAPAAVPNPRLISPPEFRWWDYYSFPKELVTTFGVAYLSGALKLLEPRTRRLRVKARTDQNQTLKRKPNHFAGRLLFLRQWKVYVLPRFRHKTSTAGAAFAGINIAEV
jgi:hypothetical protein